MASSNRTNVSSVVNDPPHFGDADGQSSSSSSSQQRRHKTPAPTQVTPPLQEDDDNEEAIQPRSAGSKRSVGVPSSRKALFASAGQVCEDVSSRSLLAVPPTKRFRLQQEEGEEGKPNEDDNDVISDYSQLLLLPTQPVDYSQTTTLEEPDDDSLNESFYFLKDNHTNQHLPLEMKNPNNNNNDIMATDLRRRVLFTFGRDRHNNTICCPSSNTYIGRLHHAQLVYDPVTASFALETDKKGMCFVLKGRKWVAVDPYESSSSQHHLGPASSSSSSSSSSSHRVEVGGIFRLIPNPKSTTVMMTLPQPGVQFTLCCSRQLPSVNPVGTASFDQQYLKLLQHINNDGKLQRNEKGENWTLSDSYSFVVDLRGGQNNNKNLLPLTTLRKMFNGRAAVIEALWYLRGEDHIRFLQDFRQHFWDKQADQDTGWVGYNYGLLTNYENFNQLEVNVIRRLVQNKSSRNMVCSLVNPNQATVQNACTSAVQFAVSHENGQDYLDLTIEQRSSDVILGLPHDVVVWTVILHLVRREVHRRSGPHLHAGRVFFNIAAGGAHVYILNQDAFVTLLSRRPKPNVEPELIMSIDKSVDMFDFAKTYTKSEARGYGKELMGDKSSFDKMYPVLAPTADPNNRKVSGLWVAGYTDYHEQIVIEQAG